MLTDSRNEGVIAEVAAERERQKQALGWTAEHDDTHADGEILEAAVAFVWGALGVDHDPVWKSDRPDRTPRQKLIRAAALIVAEIERLDRASTAPFASGEVPRAN